MAYCSLPFNIHKILSEFLLYKFKTLKELFLEWQIICKDSIEGEETGCPDWTYLNQSYDQVLISKEQQVQPERLSGEKSRTLRVEIIMHWKHPFFRTFLFFASSKTRKISYTRRAMLIDSKLFKNINYGIQALNLIYLMLHKD